MLFALTLVLIAVWFVAVGFLQATGGFVHIFLVLAMISLGWHLMEKRRKVTRKIARKIV